MMQQITNDRLNHARQQAEAHRQSLKARLAHWAESVWALDKETLRQDPGTASRHLAAVKILGDEIHSRIFDRKVVFVSL